MGQLIHHRAQIDDGIECIEAALAALVVVLPATAEVLAIDQIAPREEPARFNGGFRNFGRRKQSANNDKPVHRVPLDVNARSQHGEIS